MKVEREPIALEQEKPRSSMKEAISFLKSEKFNPETNFYEFEILEEITAEDIKESLTLPYEIGLTEQENKIILSTGTKTTSGKEHQYLERVYHSRLSLHTHPIKDGKSLNTPSFGDIYTSDIAEKSTPLLLAHKGGLIHYRNPHILDGEEVNMEAREIMLRYGRKHGVDILGYKQSDGNLRTWNNMDKDEQATFTREFACSTGVILKEASWEDTEGIKEILDIINLKKDASLNQPLQG